MHRRVQRLDCIVQFAPRLKKPSYGTNHAHSGEYDGPTIEKEMARIDGWVKSESRQSSVTSRQSEKENTTKKQSWISKLFG